jgi:signal transduction histidine kinase/DNA-binding response OmpR family regulator
MTQAGATRSGKREKILYIEDDPQSRTLVRSVLERAGYEVVEAEDGLSGIERALREPVHLILLDLNLPEVDGHTVAAILRTFPKLSDTPMVGITAYAGEGDRERTLVAGCDGYIPKPIDVDRFPQQITEFLAGKRERVPAATENVFLRDLNQRLVLRLLAQLDELKRLNNHVEERARRLEEIHEAVRDLTSELGLDALLERMLPRVARALGAVEVIVELSHPPGPRLAPAVEPTGLVDVEWKFPLAVRGRPLGFVIARYLPGSGPTPEDEHLFKIVANHVAIAIENARLYETERAAHAGAEAARRRAAFLAEASAVLASSLDYDATLSEVARLAVPSVADLCVVDILEADGSVRRAVVFAGDGGKVELASALRRHVPDPGSLGSVAETLRSGQPRVIADIPDSLLPSIVRDPEHLRVLRELAPKSAMVVPILARGRTLGAITFVAVESGRRYEPADLHFAEDLTARAALAIDNARLYREAHDADRRKDQFLAVLAHELRASLAPIASGVEIVRRYEDEAAVRRACDIIDRRVQYQARLLDDLLDLARIGHGKIELQKTELNVASVIASALDVTRPLVEGRHQRLSLSLPETPIMVTADPTRLEQVIVNLLTNAVRYTPSGGLIWVAAEREGDTVVVRVRDTGQGIPPGMLQRVFDLYTQVGRSGEGGGLGIGLALVQRLVHLHGGTVDAYSEGPGRGAEFVVRLPVTSGPRPT